MEYNAKWDLSTIPDSILRSEWGRRNAGKRKTKKGGYIASCTCGKCRTCKMREYQQARRTRLKTDRRNEQ